MTSLFILPQHFPDTCRNQDPAEELFDDLHIDHCGQIREHSSGDAAGDGREEDVSPLDAALLFPEAYRNERTGQEEQQIDPPGSDGIHSQHRRQPDDQQAPAAHAQPRQEAQHGSDDQNFSLDSGSLPR